MSGSHRKRSLLSRLAPRITGAVLVIALLAGAGMYGASRLGGGCSDGPTLRVDADPAIAPTIQQIVEDDDQICADLVVRSAEPTQTLDAIGSGEGVPALWIPDSRTWLVRAGQSAGSPVAIATNSVASTPAVLVSRDQDGPRVSTWLDVLRLDDLRLGDPLTRSESSAPIAASLAESADAKYDPRLVTAAVVPIAQAQQAEDANADPTARMDMVRDDGGYAVETEQAAVKYGSDVTATVPEAGSMFLDFPIAVTEPAGPDQAAAGDAADELGTLLTSEPGRAALADAGFRAVDRGPLGDERGVGAVDRIVLKDQSALQDMLRQYAQLALPTRALAVEDVSGSMAFQAGDRTRMALTIDASQEGVSLFPGNAQLGLWSFSTKLRGAQDHRALVPIERLDATAKGGTQRDALSKAIGDLEPKVGGGTGLYDTTLAAFREMRKTYDPAAINSVILLTDGANDDPGSISLKKLIDTIRAEQDATRPVIIITIGITDDADADVLEKISEATGGSSFTARDPRDIATVFAQALQRRVG